MIYIYEFILHTERKENQTKRRIGKDDVFAKNKKNEREKVVGGKTENGKNILLNITIIKKRISVIFSFVN